MMMVKDKKAFTLVEIIVSVAALSLICALVLQLFLLAGDLNKRSEDKQYAVVLASNLIESIKGSNDVYDIFGNDIFADSEYVENDNDLFIKTVIDEVFTANISMDFVSEVSSSNGDYYDISVIIIKNEDIIYMLEGGKYFAK